MCLDGTECCFKAQVSLFFIFFLFSFSSCLLEPRVFPSTACIGRLHFFKPFAYILFLLFVSDKHGKKASSGMTLSRCVFISLLTRFPFPFFWVTRLLTRTHAEDKYIFTEMHAHLEYWFCFFLDERLFFCWQWLCNNTVRTHVCHVAMVTSSLPPWHDQGPSCDCYP